VPRGHSPSDLLVQLRSLDAVLAVREMPGEQLLRLGADPATALARQSSLAIHQEAIDKVIRGQRAAALGDLAGAAVAWEAGFRAAPDFKVNYALLLNLAAQMARAGRAGEAETLLKSLMEIAPENTEAQALLDRIQRRRAR